MAFAEDLFGHTQLAPRAPTAFGNEDFCKLEGALKIKETIEAYWAERGHAVMIELKNVGFHPAVRAARYEIRSDMCNGLPRSMLAKQQADSAEIAQ